MNGAHYHLLVNHVSLFAIFFGLCALIWALTKNSKDMMWGASILFVLAGIFGWLASETGGMAAKVVKELPTYQKELVHTHAQAADFAEAAGIILAVIAIATMLAPKWKPKFYRPLQILLLIVGLWAFSVVARTAYLGGMINHVELR